MPSILELALSRWEERAQEAALSRVPAGAGLPLATGRIPGVGALQGASQGGKGERGEV